MRDHSLYITNAVFYRELSMKFILVHGTFSSPKIWNFFDKNLTAQIKGAIVERWKWSGKNYHKGRLEAARQLAIFVKEEKTKYPESPLFLVGHSHGGNICRTAASLLPPNAINGVVYISTPHIYFSPRRGKITLVVAGAIIAAVLLLFSQAVEHAVLSAGMYVATNVESSILRTALSIITFALEGMILALTLFYLREIVSLSRLQPRGRIRRLVAFLLRSRTRAVRSNCIPDAPTPALNVSSTRDEAFLYLITLQIFSRIYQYSFTIYFIFIAMISALAIFFGLLFIIAICILSPFFVFEASAVMSESSFDMTLQLFVSPALFVIIIFVIFTVFTVIYWLSYGGPWNYGIRSLADIFFLKISVFPRSKTHEDDVAVIAMPILSRILQFSLRHSEILKRLDTVQKVATWATQVHTTERDVSFTKTPRRLPL